MPYFPPTTGYQDASHAVSNLGNAFNNVAMGMAQHRAQQAQMQQMMMLKRLEMQRDQQLSAAQAKQAEAHATLYGAEAALSGLKGDALKNALLARAGLKDQFTALPNITMPQDRASMMGEIMGNLSQLDHSERNGLLEQAAQAANFDEMGPLIATGTKALQPVGKEGGVYDTVKQTFSMAPREFGRNLVDPNTGNVLATKPEDDELMANRLKYFASLQAGMGNLMRNPGMSPEDPSFIEAHQRTKDVSDIIGPALGFTNAPAQPTYSVPPMAPGQGVRLQQFKSEAEAKAAGKRKGDQYMLWDQMSNTFRPWLQEVD